MIGNQSSAPMVNSQRIGANIALNRPAARSMIAWRCRSSAPMKRGPQIGGGEVGVQRFPKFVLRIERSKLRMKLLKLREGRLHAG